MKKKEKLCIKEEISKSKDSDESNGEVLFMTIFSSDLSDEDDVKEGDISIEGELLCT